DTGSSPTIQNLNRANRNKRSFGFDQEIILIRGISNPVINGDKRNNWLVMDLPIASEAYLASVREIEEQLKGRGEKQLEKEAALLAKQRREMRVEMARMRKQIDDMEQGNGQSVAESTRSIEERMSTLDALLAKELISKEEYDVKRQEILNDI
ncbi:MAG: hypothetical protein AAF410_06555, partial [Pseudomonadota bacterium]